MNNNDKIITKTTNLLNELPDYVNEWYYNMRAGNKSYATCYDYVCKIKQMLTAIGNGNPNQVKVGDIKYSDVAKYFISLQKKKMPDGTMVETSGSFQQTNWYAINAFCDFMCKRNYMRENPMLLIDKNKTKDLDRINQHRTLLTDIDFNKILTAVESKHNNFAKRDIVIMLLFMTTGMRKSALSNIDISDIDFENHTLKVVDKGNKIHFYNLTDELINDINKWLEYRKCIITETTDALFLSKYGKRITPDGIFNLVENYCEQALGKRLSPHKLRSGFCSILYEKTGDIEFVRRAVGHSNVATTQRYIVTNGNEKVKASNIIGDIFKK